MTIRGGSGPGRTLKEVGRGEHKLWGVDGDHRGLDLHLPEAKEIVRAARAKAGASTSPCK